MTNVAIILAGGKGERLRPLTSDRPKPMVEVAGKPIVYYQLKQLKQAGIDEVVFACSYRREFLKKSIGNGQAYGIKATFSVEVTPLGRGGAIKKAMRKLPRSWQNVVVTNGDNLWQLDLGELIKKHQKREALATIVVVPLKSPYGVVQFDKKDQILGFKEKPLLPHWINAGVYIFNRKLIDLLPDVGDHETTTFPRLPKDKFLVFKSTSYWRGVDTVKDLSEATKEILEKTI